jgi:uncharacterized BrkB/YihY/UPF0761 family membrane protein
MALSFVFLCSSFSFAYSNEAQKKADQLLFIIVNYFNDEQILVVHKMIENCAKTNKNEVVKEACQIIVDEFN